MSNQTVAMDARLIKHQLDQFVAAFADVEGTIRFCERRIWDAAGDHEMKPETEQLLVDVARNLSALVRLMGWEIVEIERLGISVGKGIEAAK